jgi:hypothetical protein
MQRQTDNPGRPDFCQKSINLRPQPFLAVLRIFSYSYYIQRLPRKGDNHGFLSKDH